MRHKIYYIIFYTLIFMFINTNWCFGQQEILGAWEGELTVEQDNKVLSTYKIMIYVEQNGKKITASSWLVYQEYKANIALKGDYNEKTNVLTLEDASTIEADELPNKGEWCKKIMYLHYFNERNVERLEGNWSGNTSFSTCTPGKIILQRIKDRA